MTETKEVEGLGSEEIKLRIDQIEAEKVKKVAKLCWQLMEGEFDGDPWNVLEVAVQDMPFYQMIREGGEDKRGAVKKSARIIGGGSKDLKKFVDIALALLKNNEKVKKEEEFKSFISQDKWEPALVDGCVLVL